MALKQLHHRCGHDGNRRTIAEQRFFFAHNVERGGGLTA